MGREYSTIKGKVYKGIYITGDIYWSNGYCFNKKYYTKEQAVQTFKELQPKKEIDKVYSSFIRFLWKSMWVDDYDDGSYTVPVGAYFEVNKSGRGAMECWVILPKRDIEDIF